MFHARYVIDMKMVFGKKICPNCGKKMKIHIVKKDLTPEEKIVLEYRAEVTGKPIKLNGKIHGYNAEMCLMCDGCRLILDSEKYSKVRSEQKKQKKLIFSKEELKVILSKS